MVCAARLRSRLSRWRPVWPLRTCEFRPAGIRDGCGPGRHEDDKASPCSYGLCDVRTCLCRRHRRGSCRRLLSTCLDGRTPMAIDCAHVWYRVPRHRGHRRARSGRCLSWVSSKRVAPTAVRFWGSSCHPSRPPALAFAGWRESRPAHAGNELVGFQVGLPVAGSTGAHSCVQCYLRRGRLRNAGYWRRRAN